MRNTPLKGFLKKSPVREDIDTTWADKVYAKVKVDEDLIKKNLHTEGGLRGTTNTSPGEEDAGINYAMIDTND